MIGTLLAAFAAHFALTALPAAAAALIAARLGVRRVPVLLAIGLAASGVLAMLAFWSYYGGHTLGESFSYFILFGSILALTWSLYGRQLDHALLRQLVTPFALWGLGSFFLIFLGFLHGGASLALPTAATRFSSQLPSDNDIPRFFAEWFYLHGHHGTPPPYPGEWLFSDRPPLQVGYVLAQRPFFWGEEPPHYETLGVILQQSWIIGLWALLLAARVGRLTRTLAIVTVLVSDVAIVNGFFVWPKMLPVAMLLAAAALVVTPLWSRLRRDPWIGLLVGALLALALLAHGGSAFGVIPLVLIAALRGLPSRRWFGAALMAGVVLMVPWSAYQKYADPPGNRLTKWMIAGVPNIDSRGLSETIIDSYEEAGIGGTLHNKAENFVTMVGGGPMVNDLSNAANAVKAGHLGTALAEVRTILFFYLLPSLGLLLIAPLAMVVARGRGRLRPSEWGLALTCFAVVAVGAVAWGLILFGNEAARTVMHQGSFLLPVLGLCGAVCGLRATFPHFATWFVAISALIMFAIYVPALTPPPGTSYSFWAALLAATGLAGFVAIAWLAPSGEPAAALPPAAAP